MTKKYMCKEEYLEVIENLLASAIEEYIKKGKAKGNSFIYSTASDLYYLLGKYHFEDLLFYLEGFGNKSESTKKAKGLLKKLKSKPETRKTPLESLMQSLDSPSNIITLTWN